MRINSCVQYFPRGGSAIVVNYLNRELTRRGETTRVICGSLGEPGQSTHAATFYKGLNIAPYDYNPAAEAHRAGINPITAVPAPFHPSFEDRGPHAPDPQATALAPAAYAHLINAWAKHLRRHRSAAPDILHLHHLSHLQHAAALAYPGTARITTLHGTDLKLLDHTRTLIRLAARVGTDPAHLAHLPAEPEARRRESASLARRHALSDEEAALLEATNWPIFRHACAWSESMNRWARYTGPIVTVSTGDRAQAARLLQVPEESITVIPNGVDLNRFTPTALTAAERLAHLRRWLVEDPRGFAPGAGPGTVRYTEHDLNRMLDHEGRLRPIILWVGRYQRVKRLTLLLEAFARARPHVQPAPVLLLWGGTAGECEGEHPLETATRLGIESDVYLTGWRGHDELPLGLACAALMAAPAVGESFGMVYVEAMAAGIPPIATRTGGPADIITADGPRADGWTIAPDDPAAMTDALIEALSDRDRLAVRGLRAAEAARAYAWPVITDRYQEVYKERAS